MNIHEQTKPTGKLKVILENVITGEKEITEYKNTFMTAGKNSIAQALRGVTNNNQGIITYCAVGTDATAPQPSNTKLGAELFRKLISVREISGDGDNIAEFTIFFTTSEANGTLREAGLFGDDASGTADSGTLFAHTAINKVKSSSDTLTIVWQVTIG